MRISEIYLSRLSNKHANYCRPVILKKNMIKIKKSIKFVGSLGFTFLLRSYQGPNSKGECP